ncbi:MAG: hypothetical protein ACI8RP_001347, partial [Urechidicola sp.]
QFTVAVISSSAQLATDCKLLLKIETLQIIPNTK